MYWQNVAQPPARSAALQSKEVLRIRWGMSQDKESNPRSPLAKDKKIWAKINNVSTKL